jgi:hypothetical protein
MKHNVHGLVLIISWSISLAATAREIPRSDSDFPKINGTPQHIFLLHGHMDASVNVHFQEIFVATNPKCSDFTKETIWVGTREPYGATLPLDLRTDGLRYEAYVAVDAVLPGRCRWEFRGISAKGADSQGYELAFLNGANLTPVNSPPLAPGKSPNGVLDESCRVSAIHNGISPPVVLECRAVNMPYRTSAAWWYPSTNDLEVNFHHE